MNRTECLKIVAAMRSGGYFEAVMARGVELDRVKTWLRALAGEIETPRLRRQNPAYPCFPGLRHRPFHDDGHPGARALEDAWSDILGEALALDATHTLAYTRWPLALRLAHALHGMLHPRSPRLDWSVYPFHYMGVKLGAPEACARTAALIDALPGLCADYPWGDALFSIQGPRSRLPPHCSVDNLRLRCHLALRIPPGTGIRVGGETRRWAPGRCLLFEDSFEHEVWNESGEARLMLIVDFWHPDLTPPEIRAITAGFRKSDVRRIFLHRRLGHTHAPQRHARTLEAALATQDEEPLVREFWPR